MDDWVAKKLVHKERIEQDYLNYLLAWMIEGHFNLGDYRKARVLLERDLPFIERHGEKHFEYANVLNNVGAIYSKLGNRDKAIDLLEKALKLKEEYYGNNHLECAKVLVALSSAHGTFGDHIKEKELV
jgi:tetratricopeptide (TPR) repeat protein